MFKFSTISPKDLGSEPSAASRRSAVERSANKNCSCSGQGENERDEEPRACAVVATHRCKHFRCFLHPRGLLFP
uniref:Uncharacterized protein n=1 Tax=Ascaris lumbricoides TaxID=6252 RepID=A0A0M3HYW8_ASCLU